MKTFNVLFKRNGKVERGIMQGTDENDIREELKFIGLKIISCIEVE